MGARAGHGVLHRIGVTLWGPTAACPVGLPGMDVAGTARKW